MYCPVCGSDYETPTHIFLECDFARDFWRKSPFRLCTKSRSQCDFGAWCHEVNSVLDEEQRGLFITLIWGLWFLRNKWVFEGKREHVGLSLLRLVDSWHRYAEAMKAQKIKGKGKEETAPKWSSPERGWLKANVDAAMGRGSKRGVGVIVRNGAGEVMVAAHKNVRVDWDVDTMEAFAVLFGLQVCWEAGYQRIALEMDSKTIADALNKRKSLQNYASTFIHEAQVLGNRFSSVSVTHVRRGANGVAHELARLALNVEGVKIWFGGCPPCIEGLIEREKLCTQGTDSVPT